MTEDPSLLLVFGAGLLSFLSPCVLPLIPSYISILGGMGLAGVTQSSGVMQSSRRRLTRAAAAFVLGFSAVFIILGMVVSTALFFMSGATVYINRIAGIVVIILGLNVIFDFLSFLNYEKRPFLGKLMRPASGLYGIPAAFIAGAAFGAGWTPCIGPVLTGVLLLAGQSGKTGAAICYLAVYSAGLGLPFLIAAIFFDTFLKHTSRLHKHLPLIRRLSGGLLIVIGIIILTGKYSALNGIIQGPAQDSVNQETAPQDIAKTFTGAGLPLLRQKVAPPDFSLPRAASGASGDKVSLGDLRGKVVFLNFWATWCGPCREELPSMEALYGRYKEKGLEILAVNMEEEKMQVLAFMKTNGLSFTAALDIDGITGKAYGIRGIPTSFIIDREGNIIAHLVGSIDWNTPKMRAAMEMLLEQ